MTARIIVTGSRTWDDHESIRFALPYAAFAQLRVSPRNCTVVVGDCPTGADAIVTELAPKFGMALEIHRADWNAHGKSAGPKRNQKMAESGANLCIAFWDGESRGTLDMIQRATRFAISVRIVPKLPRSE